MMGCNNKIRWGYVMVLIGAMLAYGFGSSFGTGQEAFQFYTVHGIHGVFGNTFSFSILAVFCIVVFRDCRRYRITTLEECYDVYFGKYVGKVIYWYTSIYMFCMLIQLISGSGSIVTQYFGTPYFVGACGMALLAVVAVIFGMEKVISIISKIAPAIALLVVIIMVASLLNPVDGLSVGSEMAAASDSLRIHDSWVVSFILNHSYTILFFFPFLLSLVNDSKRANVTELAAVSIGANIVNIIVLDLIILAQIANFSMIAGEQSPNRVLAMERVPAIAAIFSIILLLAVFTTISPTAIMVGESLQSVRILSPKILGSLAVVCALAISFVGTYAQILNTFTSVSGWIGLGAYACIIFTKVCRRDYLKSLEQKMGTEV